MAEVGVSSMAEVGVSTMAGVGVSSMVEVGVSSMAEVGVSSTTSTVAKVQPCSRARCVFAWLFRIAPFSEKFNLTNFLITGGRFFKYFLSTTNSLKREIHTETILGYTNYAADNVHTNLCDCNWTKNNNSI